MELDEAAREASLEVADQMIRFLNELVELDQEAMHQLVETRVPCNTKLTDHPTVQVRVKEKKGSVGLLGILNGYIGTDADGWGFICAEYNDSGKLVRFKRTPPRTKSSCKP